MVHAGIIHVCKTYMYSTEVGVTIYGIQLCRRLREVWMDGRRDDKVGRYTIYFSVPHINEVTQNLHLSSFIPSPLARINV